MVFHVGVCARVSVSVSGRGSVADSAFRVRAFVRAFVRASRFGFVPSPKSVNVCSGALVAPFPPFEDAVHSPGRDASAASRFVP